MPWPDRPFYFSSYVLLFLQLRWIALSCFCSFTIWSIGTVRSKWRSVGLTGIELEWELACAFGSCRYGPLAFMVCMLPVPGTVVGF